MQKGANMLKLVVFDWDGTLADSVSKITECKAYLAQKYGLVPPTEETVRDVLGTKFEEAMAKCFPTANKELLEKICREFHELMQLEHYQATLFPNAKETISVLKKRGFKVAIATSKNRNEMEKAIKHNGLEGVFDLVCCGKEHQEKPNAAMLQHIMSKFNFGEKECVMVGDTTTDIQFARNANVDVICVTFGAHTREKLKALSPSEFIENWTQFTGVLDKLCSMKTYCRL